MFQPSRSKDLFTTCTKVVNEKYVRFPNMGRSTSGSAISFQTRSQFKIRGNITLLDVNKCPTEYK